MGQQAKYTQVLQQKEKFSLQPLCSRFYKSGSVSLCPAQHSEEFIHRVSLQSALKELTAKRSSLVDAAFHSFRNDTVPQEPGVLYQDSV